MSSFGIEELPLEAILSAYVHPSRQSMVGKHFLVVHLKSATGQELNGRMVTVTGFDKKTAEARLHCRFDNGDSKRLKASNLTNPAKYDLLQEFMIHSSPIPKKMIAKCLKKALKKHDGDTDRPDLAHRMQLYRNLFEKINNNTDEDNDYCILCAAGCNLLDGNFAILMNNCRPACSGNEILDLRHIDIGLKGDNTTECSICHDALQEDLKIILVTLPCLHVFHEACIVNWLGSDLGQTNWNCPTCRAVVPMDMSTYRIDYHEQLQRRVDEYPLSGFCAKCQIVMMENHRNDELPIATPIS